ncbi:AraC family transcriptional regulator [Sutterella sp.]|uniref:AraC family transcriptional regulator n=1 Tax=Sutterella sp. TaxID=1981025 RepID=UPI0026DF963B|nr:AraC family transcriptional regulator [Sutterella sp.]MDO5531603.1 AraC family transcriptional regulator [Sutterella sp.]
MQTPAEWIDRKAKDDADAAAPAVKVYDNESCEKPRQRELRLALADRVRELVKRQVPWGAVSNLPIEGLNLSYIEESVETRNCFYQLSIALILRGRKRLMIGAEEYEYGPGSALVTSIDMPTSYELLNVSPDEPFVSLSLRLNTATLAELLSDDLSAHEAEGVFTVESASEELLEDFSRILALVDRPEQIPLRAPMILRDIHFLALTGAGGENLRALYAPDASGKRIRRSIRWLKDNFREEVTIEKLASIASMAPSTFHRHFREITSMTPLQYQKRLRLYEAQQLMLRGEADASSAAYSVGYQSAAQFSREYKRLFGEPPGRHTRAKLEALEGKNGD